VSCSPRRSRVAGAGAEEARHRVSSQVLAQGEAHHVRLVVRRGHRQGPAELGLADDGRRGENEPMGRLGPARPRYGPGERRREGGDRLLLAMMRVCSRNPRGSELELALDASSRRGLPVTLAMIEASPPRFTSSRRNEPCVECRRSRVQLARRRSRSAARRAHRRAVQVSTRRRREVRTSVLACRSDHSHGADA